MASELERLLLRFEADTTALRSALRDAESGVDKYERNVERKLQSAERNFAKMGAGAQRALAGAASALAAGFSLSSLSGFVETGAKMQAVADTVGITTTRYQELASAARAAGVEQGTFDQALTKFAVSVGEVRQRTGQLYEFLRGQAPGVLQQINGAKNTSDAFDVMAEAVRRLDSAESRALLVKNAFGESSVYLTKALEGGTAGLDAAAASAKKYGEIAGPQAVQATKDLSTELDKLGSTIKARFIENIAAATPYITGFVKRLQDGLAGGKAWNEVMERLATHDQRARGAPAGGFEFNPFGNSGSQAAFTAAAHDSGQKAAQAALEGWKATVETPLALQVDPRKFFPGADAIAALQVQAAEASGRMFDAIDIQYRTDVERFRRMLDDKTLSEKQFNEARVLLSEAAATKIGAAYEKETAELKELRDQFTGAFKTSIDGVFESVVQGSFKAKNAIASLLQDLAKVGFQKSVTNPLGDALGRGLTGLVNGATTGAGGWTTTTIPAFAHGGPMSAARPHLVGERGPEIVVPNTSSRVLAGWQTGGKGVGAGNVYNIDARNSDIGAADRVMAALQMQEARRPQPVASVAAARARFPTRR